MAWGKSTKQRRAALRRRNRCWYSGVYCVTWDADMGGWVGDLDAFGLRVDTLLDLLLKSLAHNESP
jgi:hypothetical protein